ncbi:MAG: hypothetical protein FJX11_22025 [Alphaproteobacteria bacterium]|nr:hypothetical protein [Alphaproteobacteria bacterium]
MRKVLPLIVLLAVSACATAGQWQKPDTAQATVDNDLRQCRRDAVQESLRLFADWRPFSVDAPPFWNYMWAPQRRLAHKAIDDGQMQAEQALTVTCMRNKGYAASQPTAR